MIALFAILCRFASFLFIVEVMQCFMEGRIPYGFLGAKVTRYSWRVFLDARNYAEHVEFKKKMLSCSQKRVNREIGELVNVETLSDGFVTRRIVEIRERRFISVLMLEVQRAIAEKRKPECAGFNQNMFIRFE